LHRWDILRMMRMTEPEKSVSKDYENHDFNEMYMPVYLPQRKLITTFQLAKVRIAHEMLCW
jgi:hypothetical protein